MIKSLVEMQNGTIDKKAMVKTLTGMLICVGVDVTVTTLIGHHMPSIRGWRRLAIGLGTFVLGMKAGEEAENYFYKVFDETTAALTEAKNELEQAVDEASKEATVNPGG